MSTDWKSLPRSAAHALVAASARHAWLVLIASDLLTVLAGWYTATHVSINTDTGDMLDPELPHVQTAKALDAAF